MKKESSLINFEKIAEFALRLIEIIRPKFYNRITWVVVSVGLALVSTGLLEKVISVSIEKSFNIKLTGENDVAWGFSLVAIGLLYHLATTSIYELVSKNETLAKQQKYIDHDQAIFQQANEIMSGDYLSDFLHWLGNDHSYNIEDTHKLDRFCQFLARDENQFLTSGLELVTQQFLKSSLKFLEFSAYKFHIFPNNQTCDNPRLCMTPALNMDREGDASPDQVQKYDSLTAELESLIGDLREKYSVFRAEIKKSLII